MLTHAVRASRFLGRWPSYAQRDPNDLPVDRIEALVGYAFVLCGASALTYLTRRLRPARRFFVSAIGVVALWAFAYALVWIDPGEVVAWCLD